MKKFLKTTLLLTTLIMTFSACTSDFDDETIVYICTGKSATKYHSSRNCNGLSSCKGSVIAINITKAKREGRTACKLCY